MLNGKRVLVTGGTGSLGSKLVRRLLRGDLGRPGEIVVFSRDEAKQHDMRLALTKRPEATDEVIYADWQEIVRFQIGDIADESSVRAALKGTHIVFNAAALKQVPTCEYFPDQAVRTNILGPEQIVRAIREGGYPVETVVGISTDKACKPVNVMGMTKAIQERIFIQANLDCSPTRFVAARYGNVLASRGSVIPLFHEQIRRGGPVTLTTPEMTRFLMTLDQAVDTVLAALKDARPGEIYIPRVPSARMTDLATALIGDRPVEVVITGIRPGEKLHEILVSEEEGYRTADRGNYLVIKPMLPELASEPEPAALPENRAYSSADDLLDLEGVRATLARSGIAARSARPKRIGIGVGVKVMTVLGTRPEIIRLSLVIEKLDALCEHIVVHTGQNYDERLNAIFFQELGVRAPDHALGIRAGSFAEQVGSILAATERLLLQERPDRLLVLGDTNSGLAAFVAARLGIPVYHMEAGNRCYDDRVPEEVNRRAIDHSSTVLMPYTERSRLNLLREGFAGDRVYVTGNPMYEVLCRHEASITASNALAELGLRSGEYFLTTMHRQENVDVPERLAALVAALDLLAAEYQIPIICSIHPRTAARLRDFGLAPRDRRVRLVEPFGLFDFVALERQAFCVLSDSGTVQEECCIYKVPNVTIRDVTERPETVDCGSNILSGVEPEAILRAVRTVRADPANWVVPPEYLAPAVSSTAARIILGRGVLRAA